MLRPEELALPHVPGRPVPTAEAAPWVQAPLVPALGPPPAAPSFPSELLAHPAANLRRRARRSARLTRRRPGGGHRRGHLAASTSRLATGGWVLGVSGSAPAASPPSLGPRPRCPHDRTVPARELPPASTPSAPRARGRDDTVPGPRGRRRGARSRSCPSEPRPRLRPRPGAWSTDPHDRSLVQVAQLAERHDLPRRRVERRSRRYVGVTPKRVISPLPPDDVVTALDAGLQAGSPTSPRRRAGRPGPLHAAAPPGRPAPGLTAYGQATRRP